MSGNNREGEGSGDENWGEEFWTDGAEKSKGDVTQIQEKAKGDRIVKQKLLTEQDDEEGSGKQPKKEPKSRILHSGGSGSGKSSELKSLNDERYVPLCCCWG